jgi:prolyl 4-hydroxylase
MQETEARMKTDPNSKVKYSDVLEYMAYALFQQGNTKRALVLTHELVSIDPYHPRAAGNIDWYSERLTQQELDTLHDLPPIKNVRTIKNDIEERESYEKLCRGEFKPDPVMESKVYCYYKKDRPFLKLAPFKVEILRFDPLVVLFKDVIQDSEIEVIKELATPRVSRTK